LAGGIGPAAQSGSAKSNFFSTSSVGDSNFQYMKIQDMQQRVGETFRLTVWGRRTLMVLALLAAVCPVMAADSDSDVAAPSAYAKWIKPWAARPTTSPVLGGAELKVMVTTVQGEASQTIVTSMTPLERLYQGYHIKVSTAEVATNGDYRSYFVSNTDALTTPVHRLSGKDFQQLEQWLAQLPEDNGQLPPPGHRVIVQVLEDDEWHVHVYDGTKAPSEVKSILALLANPFGN
jgi:hypothetical protein